MTISIALTGKIARTTNVIRRPNRLFDQWIFRDTVPEPSGPAEARRRGKIDGYFAVKDRIASTAPSLVSCTVGRPRDGRSRSEAAQIEPPEYEPDGKRGGGAEEEATRKAHGGALIRRPRYRRVERPGTGGFASPGRPGFAVS